MSSKFLAEYGFAGKPPGGEAGRADQVVIGAVGRTHAGAWLPALQNGWGILGGTVLISLTSGAPYHVAVAVLCLFLHK